MTTREMLFHYRIMERQQAEEVVIHEYYNPDEKKRKQLPPARKLREWVEKKPEEWKK